MAKIQTDFTDAGAQLIWVLEQDFDGEPGTASECIEALHRIDVTEGWCVGDAQTIPEAGLFDDSPFSVGRGFDIIVSRKTMVVEFTTNHGTPSGNDNPSGEDVLEAVKDVIAGL